MINPIQESILIYGHEINLVTLILIGLSLVFALWQIVFHYKYFFKLAKFSPIDKEKVEQNSPSVSVVICAKNERENLKNNLTLILEQEYEDFEVIIVNDSSWDGTEDLLSFYQEKYQHLRVVEVKEEIRRIEGKKFPLTLGIKAAKNEILLLTDADCKPSSNKWIYEMVKPYSDSNIEIVLGYSPYNYKVGLLNLLIRAETSLTAMLYLSFALKRKPYMGVGRNLSYKRELFFRHKGFASHHHISSGDDDLFVRDAATAVNTAIVISPTSRMLSEPKLTFGQWFTQKKRHLFVSRYYKSEIKRKLSSFSISHFLFWLFTALLFFFSPSIWVPIGIVILRWLVQAPVVYICFKKLGHNMLAFLMPILDILYVLYSVFMGLVHFFTKKPKW